MADRVFEAPSRRRARPAAGDTDAEERGDGRGVGKSER